MEHLSKIWSLLAIISVLAFVQVCGNAYAVQILYESFETPDVTNVNASAGTAYQPTGWTSARTDKSGLADKSYSGGTVSGITGTQFAYVDDYPGSGLFDGAITTTSSKLNTNLEANVVYTLSCNFSGHSTGDGITMDFLAGTNVIATVSKKVNTANNLGANSVSLTFAAVSGYPYIGQALAVRLRMTAGAWNAPSYFDNLSLDAASTSGDVTPPSPATMLWAATPTQDVNSAITMQATNATDASQVQYFFTNTVNGNVSGWQDSPIWTDAGLTPGDTYTYKVKARDKSAALNETAWSSEASAECDQYTILYESFEEPVAPNDIAWSTYPYYTPAGWYGHTCTTRKHGGTITTPYGNQVVDVAYQGGPTGRRAEATGLTEVLTADYTYILTFAAGNDDGASGVQFTAEFIAGTNVITNLIAETANEDMSQSFSLQFIPDASHANLGETLKVRFYHSDGPQWQATGIFDNVRLRAVPPPPAGSVFYFQ